MSILIISDSQKDYQKWIMEGLNAIEGYTVKAMGIVALTEEGETLTGYWNAELCDKVQMKSEIEFDCIDSFIKANKERYFEDEGRGTNDL